MKTADYVIVGAGIAGASLAYELAEHASVIMLEAEDAPGYHSTGRSAAQFIVTYGQEPNRWLARASRGFFDAPPEGFCDHPLLSPRAVLFAAREYQLEKLQEFEAGARALAPSLERLSAAEVIELIPFFRQGYVAGGVLEPTAMDIDVHALHQGFLKGLRQRRGEIVLSARVASLTRSAGLWQAQTSAGTFCAPVLVNAAGAWADELGALAGAASIGLVPKRRTAFTFDPMDHTVVNERAMAIDVEECFYFKPESGHLLASPADATPVPPCDVQPEDLDIAITVDRIEKATTLQIRRIENKWAGLRSFVADSVPVLGFDETVEGFFWVAGQGGTGIQTSPAMGRCASHLLLHGVLPEDVAALGLDAATLAPARLRKVS